MGCSRKVAGVRMVVNRISGIEGVVPTDATNSTIEDWLVSQRLNPPIPSFTERHGVGIVVWSRPLVPPLLNLASCLG